MKILNRYILLESTLFFALSLVGFTGVLLTVQMLRFSNLVVNRGVELSQIASVFISIVPTFLELAIPLAVLLGVMLAFARLSGDSEIVVLKSSGISIFAMLKPVMFFALAVGLVSLIVSTRLKPWGHQALQNALFEIAKRKSSAGLEPGIFNKIGSLTIYADEIDYNSGALGRVMVDDRRSAESRKIIFASDGAITSDSSQQSIEISLNAGEIHEQLDRKYAITHFTTNQVSIGMDDVYGDTSSKDKSPRALFFSELEAEIQRYSTALNTLDSVSNNPGQSEAVKSEALAAIKNLNISKLQNLENLDVRKTRSDLLKKWRRLRVEYNSRFSLPFASFILGFCAMPLGVQPPRTHRAWGATISFLLALAVFVLYYGSLSLGITLVESGAIAPFVAAWIPNILVSFLAFVMIRAIGREKIQSISQIFEDLINRAVSFFSRMKRA